MFDSLIKPIEQGRLILLLGAGASLTSIDQYGKTLLSSYGLAKILAHEAGLEFHDEDLQTVYSAVLDLLGSRRVYEILEELFRNCEPSQEYITIAKYCWRRIYTLNVDDAFDKALLKYSNQKVRIRHRNAPISDKDQLYQTLDYIKLNGSSDRLYDGIIFSAKEYGAGSSRIPSWYEELSKDYFSNYFLFIGTQLNEPLFYHQIERIRLRQGDSEQLNFVLTPTASQIQKASLRSRNLVHISGTLGDFTNWLKTRFPKPLRPIDIAINANPRLKSVFDTKGDSDEAYTERLLENITLVEKKTLHVIQDTQHDGKIRRFYKGYKPSWKDIFDEIPAELSYTREFYKAALDGIKKKNERLLILYGPAGAGKTTLLMQLAAKFHENKFPTYFIDEPPQKFIKTIEYLESIYDDRYCLIYNRLADIEKDIRFIFEKNILNKGFLVCAERENSWENRSKYRVSEFCTKPFRLSRIREGDANVILNKLKHYGPWTRLAQMNARDRKAELIRNAKKQLLIGLLETTSGQGFKDIIEYDYLRVAQDEGCKYFLLIVGLATVNRINIDSSYVARALNYCNIDRSIEDLTKSLSGIVYETRGLLFARHPVYMDYIFTDIVDNHSLSIAHNSLLYSLSGLGSELRGINKRENILYKNLVNHKFLMNIYNHDEGMIKELYQNIEKLFERSGIYWLQAGRAYRELGNHLEAYDNFINALSVFDERHKKYAKFELARQEILIALSSVKEKKAYSLLDSARILIEEIKGMFFEDDIHPLIVLAEGHIKIEEKYKGVDSAKRIASEYANMLIKERHGLYAKYIESAWKIITKFALNGTWPSLLEGDRETLCLHASE